MSTFKDSKAYAFQRSIRNDIRKSNMTKGQQEVTLAIVNLWFHHKSGPTQVICPGREKLAKKANVTEKTVSRTLAMLREAGVLVVIAYPNGQGRRRTRYKVRLLALMLLCGSVIPDWIEGDLKPIFSTSPAPKMSRHVSPECPAISGSKCPTVLKTVEQPSHDMASAAFGDDDV